MAAQLQLEPPSRTRQVPIVCPGHSRPLTEVHYSDTEDGVFLISGCHDKLPMLRDGVTGDWIGTFAGHKGAVWSAKLDNEGLRAATGAADFTAKLWDAISGKEIQEFAHKHIVKSVEFSKDGTMLATGGHEGLLRVFDIASGNLKHEIAHDSSTKQQVNKVVWGSDPQLVLTGASNGTVNVWDMRSGNYTTQLTCSDKLVQDMNITQTPEGPVLSVAAGKTVKFFDAMTFAPQQSYEMPIHFHEEGGVSLHPSGSRFIAGGSDTWVRVFDRATGKEVECHKGHHGPVRCLRYAPNGETFATGSEDGTIRIWEDQPSTAQP